MGDFWDSIGNINEINTQLKKKVEQQGCRNAAGLKRCCLSEDMSSVPSTQLCSVYNDL